MAGFNGSGTFVRTHDWTTDLSNTVPVTASRMDAEDDGFATGLSNTICRDGQSTTTARIPFAAGLSAAAGTTASVSYAQTNDNNTGLYFPGSDQWGLVAGGTATLTSTATALTATGTLGLSGDFAVNTNKFTVTAASGNTAVAGTLGVTGASTLTGAVGVTGDLAVNTDKFTVTAASGNTLVAGTLAVTGAATLSSTLAAGNTTITGTLAASGNVDINTNKFNITAASGNTAIAGTLAVTGASTLTGAVGVTGQLTANNSAGVVARNTCKAFVSFSTDGSANVTVQGTAFNVSGVATATVNSLNGFRVTFSSALSAATYTAVCNGFLTTNQTEQITVNSRMADRATTTFDFVVIDEAGVANRNNITVDIMILLNA